MMELTDARRWRVGKEENVEESIGGENLSCDNWVWGLALFVLS